MTSCNSGPSPRNPIRYTFPSATIGVDWPGKSAVQSASLASILSGRFFSSDVPFCDGPRQVSQPRTGAARRLKTKSWVAPNKAAAPARSDSEGFMVERFAKFVMHGLAQDEPDGAAVFTRTR